MTNRIFLNAVNEKDIENAYCAQFIRRLTRTHKDVTITSSYGVDGVLKFKGENGKSYLCLLEFKFDLLYKSKLVQSTTLIQCLYYLKKFRDSGDKVPQVIFVGDINECFVVPTNLFEKYLDRNDIDWTIAPSQAHLKNPELLQELVQDESISPFVFDVTEEFDFGDFLNRLIAISDNAKEIKTKITPKNVERVFNYFMDNVYKEKADKLSANEKANLFVQLITNPSENYLHPRKKDTLITRAFGDIKINSAQYKSFFDYFEGERYSPKEKKTLTASVDRLVDDTVRRMKGEFFTPSDFVNLAHKYISDQYGPDWKERFVVWDCAAGTLNLTRDYRFKELYCSTLEASDLETADQHGYNPEATKFQFDFLNDEDDKLPEGLRAAIENGKEILFLINPPYATAGNMKTKERSHKAGIANTAIAQQMKGEKTWGASTQAIQAQFLYRIYRLQRKHKNIHLAIFCTPIYMTGGSYEKFRVQFFSEFKYDSGFLFQASHFADVKAQWGIVFSLFSPGETENKNIFPHNLVDYVDFDLTAIGTKSIYNVDGKEKMSDWVKNPIKGIKTYDAPQLSNAINIKQDGRGSLTRTEGTIGYFLSNANNVYHNSTRVSLFSSTCSVGNGTSVTRENYKNAVLAHSARRLIEIYWHNNKDEYLAPNEDHSEFEQFYYDSIVYSLFNNSSQQSSLRQVDYKDKKWDIKNEFFWMSREKILELAEEHNFDEVYRDAKLDNNRFVYNLLFGEERIYDKLSEDAKKVLDMAQELTRKSFVMRKIVSEEHPEYHLDSWDCGYAQLKLVWKQYYAEDFKAFRDAYKGLSERMRPMVYELGFLMA